MENILEVAHDGSVTIPAGTVRSMGWSPGDKVLLRRTEDTIDLTYLPMTAEEGAKEAKKTQVGLGMSEPC